MTLRGIFTGTLGGRFKRLAPLAATAALVAGSMAAVSVSPSAAAAIDQQLTITPVSSSITQGTIVRTFKVTNEAGQVVPGISLFGNNGGQQGGGSGPICGTGPSNSLGIVTFFDNPSYRCVFTVAYVGSSPFQPIANGDVRWPITLVSFPPNPTATFTPRQGPTTPIFRPVSGDAVVTSLSNTVTYGSPTNTPFVLSALFAVASKQADINLPVGSNPAAEVTREFQDANRATIGTPCVCGSGTVAAPAGAVYLVITIKATAPVTIGFGWVDWWGSGQTAVVSGPPIVGAPTTTTTTTTTVVGSIDVTNQFFQSQVFFGKPDPVGNTYTVIPTAPNRTYTDFLISCEGVAPVPIASPGVTPGSNFVCVGTVGRVNTITVTDKLGVLPTQTVRWYASAPGVLIPAFAGQDTFYDAPVGATNVKIDGVACAGVRCTIPGSTLVFNPTPTRRRITFTFDSAPGAFDLLLQVQPAVSTTVAPTTAPPLPGALKITAPSSVVVGAPFTVVVGGALPPGGRVDLLIGTAEVGSQSVAANGTATFQATAWWPGATSLNATWVRWVNGSPVSTKVSIPLVVTDGSAVTTAPVTTAPVTTTPVTTTPVTTAPVTTAPVTTAPVTTAPVTTTPVGALSVTTSGTIQVGKPFTVIVSGLAPSSGRVDLLLGTSSVGSVTVGATSSITTTVTAWATGQTTLKADWVRYENGTPITVTATITLTVNP
jgi:hypothetical protein